MRAPHTNELMLATVIGTMLFFLLTAFCIAYLVIYRRKRREHQQEIREFRQEFQQQLLQSRVEVQEYTYGVLSKDLHDNIGQLLSTARMLLGLTERQLGTPPDTLVTANATIGEAISELRSLSRSLDNDWLQQFSFSNNLMTEIDRINKAGVLIHTTFTATDFIPLKSDEQIILFRIVQEGLQNAVKHANALQIEVVIVEDNYKLSIMINDNGEGFNPDGVVNGMGLNNMKHRCTLLGGTISWHSSPGQGTRLHIVLPVKI